MKKLFLLRHGTHAEVGHVLSGRSEIPLSDQGRAEAAAAAEALAGMAIASIHSSPRRRTLETAAPVAAMLGLEVQIAPALDEVDFGRFSGQSFAALDPDPDWQCWNAERAVARCPGGETMAEAVTRALDYVASLPAVQFPALCVTHCDVIRGAVAMSLGLSLDRLFQFDCEPGSWTVLALDGGAIRLLSLNERVRQSVRA